MSVEVKKETMEFQAEVKQLLDIVINSLYTDREIFLRELISNSADALEKLRYHKISGNEIVDFDLPLEINITVNEEDQTLTIADTGIGMTKEELVENLGTIAHSGSKKFLKHLSENDSRDVNLIGQFGVGFYSAFMVADNVTVLTRSYQPDSFGVAWVSEGAGVYSISEVHGINRGTQITLKLKDDAKEFIKAESIKRIIKKYSGFVPFPVLVQGEKVNTVEAIWTRNKNEVSEEEYNEFYKYVANAYEEPFYKLHFSADAPLNINALLFVPKNNFERYGFGRMEPGVSLYCRKILIQQHSKDILPEWLRFVRGVVDSEELPLNISRETMQDSALISKLRRVLTKRFIKFLNEQAKEDTKKYDEFWQNFGMFIKEGLATDFTYREDLAKLLRFESSKAEPGQLVSLNQYLERMKEDQQDIYYLNGPNRQTIENSPYLEVFKDKEMEVLFTREAADDYILNQMGQYEGKRIVSIDQADLNISGVAQNADQEALAEEKVQALTKWIQEVLGDRVSEVRESKRLSESPALVLHPDQMTGSMQRVMQLINKDTESVGPKVLEINIHHPIIKGLSKLSESNDPFASLAVEQLFDNAMIAAGMIVDPRGVVERMNRILERSLN